MKKDELFDLLGEIDDKFYEEALPPEITDRAAQPLVITADDRPQRSFLRIAAPIAACLAIAAAVGIAVSVKSLNGGIVLPNTSVSENEPLTEEDVQECREYLMSLNPKAKDISEDQLEFRYRVLDLNFDGEDEVVTTITAWSTDENDSCDCDEWYGLQVFSKTENGMEQTGAIARDEQDRISCPGELGDLYPYEDGDEKYYYYFYVAGNNPQEAGGTGMGANVCGSIKFDGEKYYTENLLSFGTITYSGDPYRSYDTFYRIGWNVNDIEDGVDYGDVPRDEFLKLWAKYPELPEVYGPEPGSANRFSLDDYPELDMSEVPDFNEHLRFVQFETPSELLQRAALYTTQCSGYDITLLGRYIMTNKEADPDALYVYDLKLGLSKDGKELYCDGVHTESVSMGQGGYKLYADKIPSYIDVLELEGGPLILFNYWQNDLDGMETTFFTIKNDKLYFLMGDFSGIGKSVGICANLSAGSCSVSGNTVFDSVTGIEYTFDFDSVGEEYTKPHFTAKYPGSVKLTDISEYVPFDVNTDVYSEKALLESKQCGEYTLRLIADDVDNPFPDDPDSRIGCSNVQVVAEKDGEIVDNVPTMYSNQYLDHEKIGGYLQPFELDGGIGFVFSQGFDEGVITFRCTLYTIKDDKIVQLMNSTASNGIPSMPVYLFEWEADAEKNALIGRNFEVYIHFDTESFEKYSEWKE